MVFIFTKTQIEFNTLSYVSLKGYVVAMKSINEWSVQINNNALIGFW